MCEEDLFENLLQEIIYTHSSGHTDKWGEDEFREWLRPIVEETYKKAEKWEEIEAMNLTIGDPTPMGIWSGVNHWRTAFSSLHQELLNNSQKRYRFEKKLELITQWYKDHVEYERPDHSQYLRADSNELMELGLLLELPIHPQHRREGS